jgi:cytoskeletal protein RodZ
MKTVGKQLEEARLARNWTPEMAARETKIKVDRIRDLEADDYSNFNNATYARGFVRTYARALGLDEYRVLRQLDNKLPDDDSANIVSVDGGVAYLPETTMPPRVAHRDFTGLYVVLGLGAAVVLIMAFVLLKAYQVGELGHWVGGSNSAADTATNAAPAVADDAAPRAKPIDSNTPPPIPEATPAPVAVAAAPPVAQPVDTSSAPRALPVDPTALNTPPVPSPAQDSDIPVNAPRALPVNPVEIAEASPTTAKPASMTPPPPAPVTPPPADISHGAIAGPAVAPATDAAPTPPPADIPVNAPRALPVSAADLAAANSPSGNEGPISPAAPAPANGPVVMPPAAADTTSNGNKPLVLTASHDSFVRVTALDTSDDGKPVYAAVLHTGQSVGFNGHKFIVAVDNPSAVDIKLDGVNYGPHSDGSEPETFTVISHLQ